MSLETSSLWWLRGQRCTAHGSEQLGHLRVHADACFRFLAQLPILLHWVSTTENEKTDFDLDGLPGASIMTHTALCRRTGWKSLGEPDEVCSCSCATAHSC